MGTFWEYMDKGGPVMWPILILSIIGFAVMIERAWVLRKARINVNEFLAKIRKALMVNRSLRDAVKICEQYQGPVASVMKAGLLKHGQPKEDVEKTIENAAMFETTRLEPGDRVGVLVPNGIDCLVAYYALAKSGLSNPGLVAAGISEALITTASGLIIAIPMQLAYNYFTTRINRFVRDVETSTNMLLETYGEMERGGILPDRAPEPAAPKA